MTPTRIAIVLGSTRPGRKADTIGRWVHQHAAQRADELHAAFDVVDIAEYGLPHLDEATPAIMGSYAQPHTRAWAAAIGAYDGYVFVTPEYNHSTSGALKNAIDFLFAEWNDKACGFVSYGVQGGQRAVEHLRLVAAELQLAGVRSHLALTLGVDTDEDGVATTDRQIQVLDAMLDETVAWSRALSAVRD
ncbi:NAD(P)H-dependent oxidoreductase [Patulibacter sp. NPDC049589]|uniref:NADPH-dependent FMN reductase n=1 Tax=Patulibacter sp. NPDC049589 TaxID=3154731 RepID=UPI00343D3A39